MRVLVFIPLLAHHIARAVGGDLVRMLLIWEPAGWDVGMAESVQLSDEQKAHDEFMAEFCLRTDTHLSIPRASPAGGH